VSVLTAVEILGRWQGWLIRAHELDDVSPTARQRFGSVNALGYSVQRRLWFSLACSLLVGLGCLDDPGFSTDSGSVDQDSSMAGADTPEAGSGGAGHAGEPADRDASEPSGAGKAGRPGDAGGNSHPDSGTEVGGSDDASSGDAGLAGGGSGGSAAGSGGSGAGVSDAGSGGAGAAGGAGDGGAGGAGGGGAGAGGSGGAGAGGAGAGGSGAGGSGAGGSGAGGSGAGGSGAGGAGAGGSGDAGTPSFLSGAQADHNSNVVISGDGLSAEWTGAGIGAVRSTRSIGQHQTRVFYFEATALGQFDRFQIGVSADTRSLANFEPGTFEVAVETQGDGPSVARDDAPGSQQTYGFAVDYRWTLTR
jgi:hypothetical protein